MPKKTVVLNFNAIDNNKSLTCDIKTMSKFFQRFLLKLSWIFSSYPLNKHNLESAFLYYSNLAIPEVFHIKSTSKEVFRIMEKIEISTSIYKLSGRFLKDGAEILPKPISEICNLSISHGIFPNACKVAKLKLIFKNDKKADPSNYRPISLLPMISKIIEKLNHDQTNEFL